MVNRKYAGIAVVAVVVIIVAAVLLSGGLFAGPKAQNNTIAASVTKDCAGTPWFVAKEKNLFEKHGVNFVDKGDIAATQKPAAFIAGQTNVLEGDPNTLVNLLESGAKVKAVAVGGAEPLNGSEDEADKQHMHYLVKEDSPLHTPENIKKFVKENGRPVKVAVAATGICADIQAKEWFRKNNISTDEYEIVVLADPQQEQALQQGLIDIAALHPPFFSKAEKDGGVRTLFSSTDAFGNAGGLTFLIFTEDYIKNYPGTVRDFIKAFKEAERWTNDNRAEAGEITAKNIGLPYTANTHWYSYSGAISDNVKGYTQEWLDAMVAQGIIPEGKYTPDDLITTEFQDTWQANLPDN